MLLNDLHIYELLILFRNPEFTDKISLLIPKYFSTEINECVFTFNVTMKEIALFFFFFCHYNVLDKIVRGHNYFVHCLFWNFFVLFSKLVWKIFWICFSLLTILMSVIIVLLILLFNSVLSPVKEASVIFGIWTSDQGVNLY